MNLKTIIIFIIICILIGIGIVYGEQFFTSRKSKSFQHQSSQRSAVSPTPVPSPSPTLSPIDQNSDLNTEIKNLTPRDFSPDYQQLKEEVNKP